MSAYHTWRAWVRWAFPQTRPKSVPKRRFGRQKTRLALEELENRLVPSHVLSVNSTNDTHALNASGGSGLDASGHVTLRAALETADAIGSSAANPFTINVPAGNYILTLGFLQVGNSADTNVILNGTDLPGNIVIKQTNTSNPVFNLNPALNANVQISMANVEITGGSSLVFGGGGIEGGGVGNSLTLTDVIITSNVSQHSPGGGGIEYDGGNLTLTNCTISNNTAFGGTGAGVDFQPQNGAGTLTITGCTFSGNSATYAGGGGQGGAIYTNGTAGNSYSISTSNFTANQASLSGGVVANANGTLSFNFNRVVGNAAGSGNGIANATAADAIVDATNTWWGSNFDPSTLAGLLSGPITSNPWLVLGASANPTTVATNGMAQIMAGFTSNSAGTAVSASNLAALVGLPVSFAAVAGTIAPATTTIQSTGQATATFTAGASAGPGMASATADSVTVTAGLTIYPGVVITTGNLANWTAGQPGYKQTISATGGTGPLTLSTMGPLPPGLTLSSAGVLSGTPTTVGSYNFTVTATDTSGNSGSQNFTVGINLPVSLTTTALSSWTVGVSGYSQTISGAGGTGLLTFTETGTLPTGLSLSTSGVLAGTPSAVGGYTFTATATDTVGASGSRSYTVVINSTPSISTTALSTWTAGLSGYSQTINGSGGTGPLTFSATGSLPPGLTLSNGGVLFGAPTTAGTYHFTVTATDAVGASAGMSYSITINPAVTIVTSTLANWTLDLGGYSQTIAATGGTGPLTIGTTGTPPAGLTLTSTGVLSGTPTAAGSYSFTVVAIDTLGATGSHNYLIVINPAVALTTMSLANWTVGLAGYSQTISGTGGTGSLTFSATGSLPTGLTLSSAGVLSGTPTSAGSYCFTATAVDSLGASGTHAYTVIINPAISFRTTTLPTWTAGLAGYNQSITTSGGTGPLTFSATGSLPMGLTLGTGGILSGIPTAAGSFTFNVTAIDTVGSSASQGYTITINPAVALTTTALPAWTTGLPGYNQTISATGGTGSLIFSTAGSPPLGLTLSSTGVLSGTPTTAGSYSFTIVAIDTIGASGSKNYNLAINAPVSITTTTLTNWTAGLAGYSQTINTTGGTGSLTATATGTLPVGLTLNSAGVLSGTPTTAGSYSFTVTAADSLDATGGHGFTVVINLAVALTTTTLDNWTVGLAGYSQVIGTTGGTGPLTFSSTGSLPPGLTLSSAEVLSGTPTAVGSFTFIVKASDSLGASASLSYTVGINPAVSLTTTSLAAWTTGLAGYNQTLSASGGTGALTFSATGSLPAGLTLNSAGVISGTPTTAGSYSFLLSVTDAVGASSSHSYTLMINPAVSITTTTLANWTVGQSGYSQTLSASGGTGSLSFTAMGSIPSGLTLSSAGALSGTPTSAGSYSFTAIASDTLGATGSHGFTVVINPLVSLTTLTLPNWTAGLAGYNQTLNASGGTAPLTFSATGSLPPGLTLSTSGQLSGTPLTVGSYTFSVKAVDTVGASASQSYTVGINPALSLLATSLAPWTAGLAGYSQTLSATGGTGALTFSATGSLPAGLSLTSAGVLAGTPTTAGSYSFLITVTDVVGASASHGFTVNINPAVSITTTTLANWTVGQSGYSQTLSASGGTGSLSFTATGSVPPGLTLTSAGVLSGTPMTAGSYGFTAIATDSLGAFARHGFAVVINPVVSLTTITLPNWTAGLTGYNQTLGASGGTPPLIFSATSSLPPGLTLSSAGQLSGTPSTVGSYTFSVQTTDSVGASASQTYTVGINPPVSIMTTSLAPWTAGLAGYSQTIDATGGTGPLIFSATGSLPPGLTLDSTGVLQGTPTTPGSYSFLVFATDTVGASSNKSYTVAINPTVSVTTNTLANWTVGLAGYSQTINGIGGTGSLTFSATGSLPVGLTLSSGGVLSGTPASAGSYSFSVIATDNLGATGTHSYTVVINPPVSLSTTLLANWTVGLTGYSQVIDTTGGTGPLTFTATGSLPPGLSLSTGGVLAGTPSMVGAYSFSVSATDTVGASASQSYTVTINPAVALTTASLANWTAGLPGYSQTLHATGGTGALTFSAVGSLPPGLTLSSAGVLAGTPTTAGSYGFLLVATDTVGAIGSMNYTVAISAPVSITTATLGNWTAGLVGYNQIISASGGTGALTFSSTGSLPTGLTLSSAGLLSGTPTTAGSFGFTVTAADSLGATGSHTYTVVINPAISFMTGTLANWTAGLAGYVQTLSATGGTGTLTFSATGTLPPGLILSSAGVLAGTPATVGSYTFTVSATDSVGASASMMYTVLVNPAVSIATTSLAAWTAGLAGYNQTISAAGGTGSLLFSTMGSLPPGLTLSSGGVLSGTPLTAGTYTFAVTVNDALGANASRNYTLTINPVVSFLTTSLPNWTAGLAGYSQTISATGGTGGLAFAASGSLPTGLTLSTAGVLSGTPTTPGSYGFSVTAFDSLGAASSHGYTVVINPTVSLTTTSLANWTVGLPGYSQTIAATGGTGALTFAAAGSLPAGLTLSTGGVLSGTPSAAGIYNFSVTAFDSLGAANTHGYTVVINPAVSLTTTTLANWTAGLAGYNQTISATGGTGTKTFASIGTLPSGLTLSTAGVLSGTPSTAGSYTFTVSAFDALGAAASLSFTVIINPAVSVTTSTLANWTAGLAGYNQSITASGGTGSLTFSATGFLPSGLSLTSTGVLSGTPTTPGSYGFIVTATDTVGATGSKSYTLTINPAVSITTTTLASWTAGLPGYSQTINASGGTGSLTFSETGSLPTGLTLSSAGILSGMPTAAGGYNFTITATDTLGASGSKNFTVVINSAVSITTTTLANWTAGLAGYNQTISAMGGTGTKIFASVGTLPGGLTLSTTGVLSGTPSTAGSFNLTVSAFDALGAAASQNFMVIINPAVSVTTSTLANWTAGLAGYSQTLSASGGTGTLVFSATGVVPPGLSLSSAGVLSGTPTISGSYSFTATAIDALGATGGKTYTITINPAVSLTTTTLASWTAGLPGYSQTLSASGGTGALTFSAIGTLPTGLTLSSAGILSGTPTTAGTFTFMVTANDAVGASATATYSLVINPALNIAPASLPAATATLVYTQTITVSGGTRPYTTFAVTGFSPGGTGLSSGAIQSNPAAGTFTISGTPTAAGTVTFTINVTDTAGAMLSQSYSLTVHASPVTHFAVTASTPAAANGFVSFTVTALDQSNSVVPGYTGTVHFTSSDSAATLPPDSSLMNGVGTFTATLRTMGSQTITATDTVLPSLTGTSNVIQVTCPSIVVVSPTFTGPPGTPIGGGHTVGLDAFTTIQQALNVVCAGGTVYVSGGDYHENLTINKSVTLEASGSASAFLIGSGNGIGLTITGPSVSIAGLTVEDFGSGLTAGSATQTLALRDLELTSNTTGGMITGTSTVVFTGNATDETLIANAAQFGRSGDNLLNYSGVTLLALDGNLGSNTLDLSSASGAVGVALTGPGSLEGFAGDVSLPGLIFTNISNIVGNAAPTSTLMGFTAPSSWTINGAGVSQYTSGGQTLTFTSFGVLNGGPGSDTFTINSSAPAGVTVNGLGGGDSFYVALPGVVGPVTLNDGGGSGINVAIITGGPAASNLVVTAGTVSQVGGGTVSYTGLEGLVVNAGAGNDTIKVQGTAARTPTTISGSGADTFIVTSPTSLLNTIAGPLTLNGGAGNNLLYVSEANSTTGDTVSVTNSTIVSATGSFAPITYSSTGGTFGRGVILVTGNGNNNLRVFSTLAGSAYGLYTGNGNDTIVVGSPTLTLDTMLGSIAVGAGSGSNLLYVSEAGSSTPDNLSLSATGIQSTATGLSLTYVASGGNFGQGVYLVTGSAANTVHIFSTAAGSTNNIELGNGNNTVVVSSPTVTLDTMAGPIAVQGGAGSNLLYISEADSTTPDKLYVSGQTVQSTVTGFFLSYAAGAGGSFGRGVDVVGGGGNNQIAVLGQLAGSPLGIYAGAGNDVIDVYVAPTSGYNLYLDGQEGDNLLRVHDLTGTAIVNAVTDPDSGQILLTYTGGLPSTVRYANLHF